MGPIRFSGFVLGGVLAMGIALLAQQHSYTQADIDAGSKLYEASCGSCHGENGDRVVGVDFVKGQFKKAKSDDDLVRIIRNGVSGTGMPPSSFSEVQSGTIVAFVRSMLGGVRTPDRGAPLVAGDAARGKAVFEGKGNCTSCHAVSGVGGTSGPGFGPRGGRGGVAGTGAVAGLGAAGAGTPAPTGGAAPAGGGGRGAAAQRGGGAAPPAGGGQGGGRGAAPASPQQLERSIVDPSAEIAAAYRVYPGVPRTGGTTRGTLLNRDTFSVQLRDTNGNLAGFVTADLREHGFMPSPMPSYKDNLTAQEIADVVSYLISLR